MASSQDSQPFHWHYAELDDSDFQISGRTLFLVILLISVAILVTLLWVCLSNHPYDLSSSLHAHHAPRFPSQGLDPENIKALPTTLHKSALGASNGTTAAIDADCCICLGAFEDGDKLKVLPQCQHCFHCECLDKWLTTQSSCPLCRASASLRVDSYVVSVVTE